MSVNSQPNGGGVVPAEPPSEREREIFHAVALDRQSPEQVAENFGIPREQVGRIVGQVAEWMMRNEPEPEENLPKARQREQATRVCRASLDLLSQWAEAGWEASMRDKVTRKERTFQGESWVETTVVNQSGKVGYLNQLHRIILARARLAGVDVSGLSLRKQLMAEASAEAQKPAQGIPHQPAENVKLEKSARQPENRLSPAAGALPVKLEKTEREPENHLSPAPKPENRLSPRQRRQRLKRYWSLRQAS